MIGKSDRKYYEVFAEIMAGVISDLNSRYSPVFFRGSMDSCNDIIIISVNLVVSEVVFGDFRNCDIWFHYHVSDGSCYYVYDGVRMRFDSVFGCVDFALGGLV